MPPAAPEENKEKKTEQPPKPPAPPPVVKAEKVEKPLPLPLEDVIGTPQEQVVRNWNAQAKAGIIFQCKEEGCYYPCAPVRDANNQPVVFTHKMSGKNGKVINRQDFLMTCTYHPEHGSTIPIPSSVVVLKGGERQTSVVGFKFAAAKKDDDLDSLT